MKVIIKINKIINKNKMFISEKFFCYYNVIRKYWKHINEIKYRKFKNKQNEKFYIRIKNKNNIKLFKN